MSREVGSRREFQARPSGTPSGTGLPAPWRSALQDCVRGRRFVVMGGPLVGAERTARVLQDLGAAGALLVGYGPAPSDDRFPYASIERPPGGLPEVAATTFRSLPGDVRAALNAFDADHEALVLGPGYYESDVLADRHYIGARPQAWRSLEDKTTIDALWDDVGILRAPSAVVPATSTDLIAAASRLDRGAGTVWSGDASSGTNSGGELVRLVRTAEQAARASELLSASCEQARVAPFLAGVPCSIHAFVSRGGVAVFRPVEIITLRQATGQFLYAGVATWWDPPVEGREDMRATARRIARHLASTLSYRGAFGIDGIYTDSGFLPTELNARWGAGLYPVTGPTGQEQMGLVETFIADGLDGPMDVLESNVVAAADARRWGGPTLTGHRALRIGRRMLTASGEETTQEAEAVAQVRVSGDIQAAEITVRPRPSDFLGLSVAGLGVKGFRLADQAMGTDIGAAESWDQP